MRIAAVVIVFLILLTLPGCVWDLEAVKRESAFLKSEIVRLQLELDAVAADDPLQADKVAKIQATIDTITPSIDRLNGIIADMQAAGWSGGLGDWLEIAALIAVGFVPGGAIAVPFIRSARRSLDHVFDSVNKGEGIVNPALAKSKLQSDPATYLRFLKWKAANELA